MSAETCDQCDKPAICRIAIHPDALGRPVCADHIATLMEMNDSDTVKHQYTLKEVAP